MNQSFLLYIVLLLALAKIVEKLFSYGHISPLVAHVVTGIILGPHVLGIVNPSEALEGISYFGLLLLMLYSGITTNFSEVRRVRLWIVLVGISGIVTTIALTFVILRFFCFNVIKAILVSVLLSNTATEVVATVVSKSASNLVRTIVIGASIVDDVLAVLILGIVASTFLDDGIFNVIYSAMMSISFFFIVILLSNFLIKYPYLFYQRIAMNRVTFASTTITLACLLALITRLIGLNELIGIYIAGLIVSRGREHSDPLLITNTAIAEFIDQLKIFLESLALPLFFTYVGLLMVPQYIDLLLYICLLPTIIAGKVLGCGLTSYIVINDKHSALSIGIAMIGRGALETALLKLLLDRNMISMNEYSTILIISISTTILTPLLYNLTTNYKTYS
ncbi:MAG: cation:proton antiporter [Ignisphaera sp.]